jgi:predicted pyridoxine 5'-phosphate oxidase superfamily flavin-nucleotide-binding protein
MFEELFNSVGAGLTFRSAKLVHVNEIFFHAVIIDMVADFDVELTEVDQRFSVRNTSEDDVSFAYIDVIFKIKDCLLPMSTFRVG